MGIEDAIAAVEGLRDLLAQELARADAWQRAVRGLDAQALFAWVSSREAFHAEALALQKRCAESLEAYASRLGLAEVSVDAIATVDPRGAERLADRLGEVRELAAKLAEHDRTGQHVTERALACVRAYTSTLSPQPAAYDRRGQAVPASPASTRHRSI